MIYIFIKLVVKREASLHHISRFVLRYKKNYIDKLSSFDFQICRKKEKGGQNISLDHSYDIHTCITHIRANSYTLNISYTSIY